MDEQPKQGPQGDELQPGEQTPERPEEGEYPTQTGPERHDPHWTSREGSRSRWGSSCRTRQEAIEAEDQHQGTDHQQDCPDRGEAGYDDPEGLSANAVSVRETGGNPIEGCFDSWY
jgi:hypothetical protein